MFWAVMLELVEQYRERTGGNIPGLLFLRQASRVVANITGNGYNLDQEKY